MRNILIGSAVLALAVASVQAAPQLTVSLTETPVAGTPGTFNIAIYAETTGTDDGQGGGGMKGMQIDILSNGTGLSTPVVGTTIPTKTKVVTTFNPTVSGSFSTTGPSAQDTAVVDNPAYTAQYTPDGDLDALGLSFADGGDNFALTTLGLNTSVLIATEQWKLTGTTPDTLTPYIIGAQYYNFNGSPPDYADNYTSGQISTSGVVISVPEPASLSLLGLGALGLVARRRRA